MTAYDANGAQITCTSTKAEYEAAQGEPVHFVASEGFRWSDD